jgi:iron complex outermembrane receptor protein
VDERSLVNFRARHALGQAARVFNFGDGFEPEQTYGAEWGVDLDVEFSVT